MYQYVEFQVIPSTRSAENARFTKLRCHENEENQQIMTKI